MAVCHAGRARLRGGGVKGAIGNVCPARKGKVLVDATTGERHPYPPSHEPVEKLASTLGLFMGLPLTLAVCKHCGVVYAEARR